MNCLIRLLPALLGLAVFSASATTREQFHFEVLLGDRPIGEHRFEIRRQGEQQQIFRSRIVC